MHGFAFPENPEVSKNDINDQCIMQQYLHCIVI